MIDGALLERLGLRRQRRIAAQPSDIVLQPALVVLAHRMIRLRQHFAQLLHQRASQPVGQVVGDAVHRGDHVHGRDDARPFLARELHQQIRGALAHLLRAQVAAQSLQRGVQQLLMASVAGQQAQHLAGRGGRVPAPQVGHHELLDHAAHRAVVQQIQRLQRHAARPRSGRAPAVAAPASGPNARPDQTRAVFPAACPGPGNGRARTRPGCRRCGPCCWG